MAPYVALVRGINVGGKHRLPMKDLVDCFEAAGCHSVRTYIQSGNVVFESGNDAAGDVDSVRRLIAERFGFSAPIVLRSGEDLDAAVAANPFVNEGVDPKHLHVGFLGESPSPDAVASLDPKRSSTDRFEVRGREVYLYVPGGVARTKLTTDYFDRRLGTPMTVRNWRTVNRLAEMVRQR